MDSKDYVINELKLCTHYYEEKLIEVLGYQDFLEFSLECSKKMQTIEAHDYICGITEVMPK